MPPKRRVPSAQRSLAVFVQSLEGLRVVVRPLKRLLHLLQSPVPVPAHLPAPHPPHAPHARLPLCMRGMMQGRGSGPLFGPLPIGMHALTMA